MRCSTLVVLLFASWIPSGPASAAPFFTGLGLGGGAGSYTKEAAISADGSTVVGGGSEAWRWTAESGVVGWGSGEAVAVSADGSVVVGRTDDTFVWTEANGMAPLDGSAFGLSDDGGTVYGSRFLGGSRAARWSAVSGAPFEALTETSQAFAHAVGASADGSVIAGVYHDSDRGFVWTEAGGLVDIGSLPGPHGVCSDLAKVQDISADGSTIVGWGCREGGYSPEAFFWTSQDGMVGLGHFPNSNLLSQAYGVSADGSTIVGAAQWRNNPSLFGFIWDEENGMRRLDQVLAGLGLGSALQGWHVGPATAISDDGSRIVGWGTNPDGEVQTWLAELSAASVPEPGTSLLLGVAGWMLVWRRSQDA